MTTITITGLAPADLVRYRRAAKRAKHPSVSSWAREVLLAWPDLTSPQPRSRGASRVIIYGLRPIDAEALMHAAKELCQATTFSGWARGVLDQASVPRQRKRRA